MKKLSFLILFMTSLLFSYDATKGAINNIGGSCYKNTTCQAPIKIYTSCESALGVAHYTGPIIGGGGVNFCTPAPVMGVGSTTFCFTSSVDCSPPPAPLPKVLSSSQTDTGSTVVDYDDGSKMIIFPDLTAFTFDVSGNLVPNYAFNGKTPPASTPFSDTYAPNSNYKAKSFLENLFFSGNGTPLITPKDGRLSLLAVGTDIGGIQFQPLTDVSFTKNGEKITKSPSPTAEHPNAVSIDVTTMNFDNIDFSEYENKATSTPTPVPNTEIVVEKIDSTNQAKAPAIHSGTVVAHNGDDYSQFIASTPTTLSIGSQAPNGTVTQTTFNKADLTTSITTGSALNSFQEVLQPIKQNVDGTSSQTVTFTPISTTGGSSSVGVTTTQTTVNSPSSAGSGSTSSTFYSGSGTIDLSGVTSRLDRISSQLTYSNNKLDQLTSEPVGTSNLNTKISEYSAKLSDLSLSVDNALDFINNLKSSLTDLENQFNDAKAFFDDKPTITLQNGTCPFNVTLYHKTYIADVCQFVSPYRPILAIFFTLIMSFSVFMFSIKYLFDVKLGGK